MRLPIAALLVPLLVAVAGCTLVDQRTFQRAAPGPAAAEIARAKAPALPLVSIRLDQPGADYRPALAEAVQAAQQRKPDVTFDVLAMVPSQATAGEQDRRAGEAAQDAREVAAAMVAVGIPQDRMRLGLRGDPGTPPREVRIYVR